MSADHRSDVFADTGEFAWLIPGFINRFKLECPVCGAAIRVVPEPPVPPAPAKTRIKVRCGGCLTIIRMRLEPPRIPDHSDLDLAAVEAIPPDLESEPGTVPDIPTPVTAPVAAPARPAQPPGPAAPVPAQLVVLPLPAAAPPRPTAWPEPVRGPRRVRRVVLGGGVVLGVVTAIAFFGWPGPSRDRQLWLVPGPGQYKGPGQGEPRPIDPSEWVDASFNSVRQGDARVRLAGVSVGRPRLKNGQTGTTRLLMVWTRVDHTGNRGRLDFRAWPGSEPGGGRPTAVLTDHLGNRYTARTLGPGEELDGHEAGASLVPRGYAHAALLFDPPSAAVPHLKLELPAEAVGGRGVFRFQIPWSMIAFDGDRK